MTRRSALRAFGSGIAGCAAVVAITGCGVTRPHPDPRWSASEFFAVREVDEASLLVGWRADDLRPRVVGIFDETVVGWKASESVGRVLLGWMTGEGATRFLSIDREAASLRKLSPTLDTGDFLDLGDAVAVLRPGEGGRVAIFDSALVGPRREIDTGIDLVQVLRRRDGHLIAGGTNADGEVIVAELDRRGAVLGHRRLGVVGDVVDAVVLGNQVVVSVVRTPASQGQGAPCVAVVDRASGVRRLALWRRPGRLAAIGPSLVAVDDTRGEQRVLTVIDLAAGHVVAEHPLSSPAPVHALAPAAGGSVLVMQGDRLTVVTPTAIVSQRALSGLVPADW